MFFNGVHCCYFTEYEQNMNKTYAAEIIEFLKHGTLPQKYSSSKSNFLSTARKYDLNKKNELTRNSKIVVLENEKADIYNALHQHSGRTTTWNRINER